MEHICCIVFVVMAILTVYYELCATVQSLHPDFIALVEMHLDGDSLQMYLPSGYVVAAHWDRT